MSALASYVLAAMQAWVPIANHSSFEPRAVTEARYEEIAQAIADGAEASPVIAGDAVRTALVLASVASFESAFAARVVSCRQRGGSRAVPAFGLFQSQSSRTRACASLVESVGLALEQIGASVEACARWPLAVYAGGTCAKNEKADVRMARAERWKKSHTYKEEEGDGS